MRASRPATALAVALVAGTLLTLPASATTMIREGLAELTGANELVLHGQVVGIHSYWNADRSFILTDVRIRPLRVAKGPRSNHEVTVTLMGGSIGELTTVIVGGPELVPGSEYALFLNREDLPGKARALTVRDLAQGVFDVVESAGRRRAVSQALAHPLLPDQDGVVEPPGGAEGLILDDLLSEIETRAGGR